MYSEKILLDLIALVYDSALDASLWPAFLEALSNSVTGSATTLMYHDMRAMQGIIAASVRVDPECERLYNQYYSGCDSWRPAWLKKFSLAGVDGIVTSEQLIAPAELQRTEFYNDFLLPYHIVHQFCAPILVNKHMCTVLSCLRPKDKGPFGTKAVTLVRQLFPHLQKAVQLERQIAILQVERDTSLESLDLLSTGFILVDRQAHVLFMNRAARHILDQNDGLAIKLTGLAAVLPAETTMIHKLVYDAWVMGSCSGLPSSQGSVAVSRPSGRRRLSLLVVPLRPNASRSRLLGGIDIPAAAILISDPESETVADTTALRQSFRLTSAEANLASILMAGKSLEEATEELRISMNTAKTQLKAIFSKTGTSRQGELIRQLLLSIAPVHNTTLQVRRSKGAIGLKY
jgi:DNA-binding CsgD family transcriptional regulator